MFISNIFFKKAAVIIIILIVVALLFFNYQRILKLFYPLHYQEAIFNYAQEYEIDPYLVAAIIKVESKFSADATSPKGARGLMQIMPTTGRWIAEELQVENFTTEDLYNPELNILFGSWYLSRLMQVFRDDLTLVIAAYNGGEGNVRKWLKDRRWTGKEKDSYQIPFPETRNYVEKVLKTYQRYKRIYQD
ncbi:lytic transglycosylase domain-containing protein [Fuchsiella alkaliacetigena]|uniref:lytic transglycosylase domain-containing protein n=1 Tax=Fuchsiella alkaliacetigena TaxID=957042 RepID=UPI00200AE773|nr:lytic transglycosylase domain-containing protein [Fuchsiella alkaliacetigena]MCK8824018.1 lytic transglycosylase domain-containing protein [Fuchsiella alkaliacetigena]